MLDKRPIKLYNIDKGGRKMTKEILALVPAYNKGMNTTILIYTDLSMKDLKVSIKTAVSRLFKESMYDERLYNERLREFTTKKNALPLVFSTHRLVSFVYRRPRSRNDGSYIYINPGYIYDIDDDVIYVQKLGKVKVLSKKRTIRKNLSDYERVMKARDVIFK